MSLTCVRASSKTTSAVLFLNENRNFRDPRDVLDGLLDHVRTGFTVHVLYRQRDGSLLRHRRAGGGEEQPEYQRSGELCHRSFLHEFSKGTRKLNAIAATISIVATTSAGLTNLLADLVEHAAAHCWFDARCN